MRGVAWTNLGSYSVAPRAQDSPSTMIRPFRSPKTSVPSGRIEGAVQTGAPALYSATRSPEAESIAYTAPTVLPVYNVPRASSIGELYTEPKMGNCNLRDP